MATGHLHLGPPPLDDRPVPGHHVVTVSQGLNRHEFSHSRPTARASIDNLFHECARRLAWLVAPVIGAPRHRESVLDPNDLGHHLELADLQRPFNLRSVGPCPNVGDVAREVDPGTSPRSPVVVSHLSDPLRFRHPGFVSPLVSPLGIVLHTVGRVGDHALGHLPVEQPSDNIPNRRVATDQPMVPEFPQVARSRAPLLPQLRSLVDLGRSVERILVLSVVVQLVLDPVVEFTEPVVEHRRVRG